MRIVLASPRGFCAGVERAIEIVENALKIYGPPVYVRHEIVHNKYVVDDLKSKGAIFVSSVDEIPIGARTIFSAHGVSDKVEEEAKARNLPVIDATCPLVTKVHIEAQKNEKQGKQIILIGHRGHPEVEGTSGKVKQEVILVENIEDAKNITVADPNNLAYVTQTTLSVDDTREIITALKERFPNITGPELKDICYATQNRQNAVKELAKHVQVILVIGSQNSSNSNRLRDIGQENGISSYLINSYKEINKNWFKEVDSIGVTAGASAPEVLIQEVINYLQNEYNACIEILQGVQENVKFKLPTEVRVE